MQVRLQMMQNWEPPGGSGGAGAPSDMSAPQAQRDEDETSVDSMVLLHWLQRLQFKLGQIEVQSSQATQFYTV